MKVIRKVMDKTLEFLLSVSIVIMTLLVLYQVFTRYVLNDPAVFTEELVIIMLIWSSYFGVAYAFGSRSHMSLGLIKTVLSPVQEKVLTIVTEIIVLIFAAVVLTYGGYVTTKSVIAIMTPVLGVSKALLYMPFMISGIMVIVYEILNIIENIQDLASHMNAE